MALQAVESLDIVKYVDLLDERILSEQSDDAIEGWLPQAWLTAAKIFVPRFALAEFAEFATSAARDFYRAREEHDSGDLDNLLLETDSLNRSMINKLDELESALTHQQAFSLSDVRLFSMLRSLTIAKRRR